MKPVKYSSAWFVQQCCRFLVAVAFVCILLAPEALIGPVS